MKYYYQIILATVVSALISSTGYCIVNGDKVSAEHFLAKVTVPLMGPADSICTAIVIGKKYLLTAAHCIPQNENSLMIPFTSDVTKALNEHIPTLVMKPVIADVLIHPDFKWLEPEVTNEWDIAIIKLPQEIPEGYLVVDLSTKQNNLKISKNQAFLVAGFGVKNKDGIERGEPIDLNKKLLQVYEVKSDTFALVQFGGGICKGDSGGPVFYTNKAGQNILIGVSWLASADRASELCSRLGNIIRLEKVKNWILKNIKSP